MKSPRDTGTKLTPYILIIVSCLLIVSLNSRDAEAARIDELRQKIDEKNNTIKQLEEEIAQFTKDVAETGKQAKTLESALKTLDLTRQKLVKDIALTENKIATAELEIERLSFDITEKAVDIDVLRKALARNMRIRNAEDQNSLLEVLLAYKNLSTFWSEVDSLERFQASVQRHTGDLLQAKQQLESAKSDTEQKKKELEDLTAGLGDQKKLVEINKKQKNDLLAQTKNKEGTYKKILSEKIALREAFERELREFESELEITIDPSKLPSAGKGVLAWPLDSIRITQYFGNTEFALAHAALYSGIGHNGVDLAAAPGTQVKSAAAGVVEGAGDTDLVCPGASYGKWVLIKHNNGLSTLYGHLSYVKAVKGDEVGRGDVVGYSGNTGYSTGPHLHFTVYATQGVRVLDRKSKVCGGTYTMPVADTKAYLNPLIYL